MEKRLHIALRVMLLALGVQVAISWTAWTAGERGFPVVSVAGAEALGGPIAGNLLLLAGAAGLLWLIAAPRTRMGTALLLGSAFLLVLADLNRLQPWLYLYAIILLPHLRRKPLSAGKMLQMIGWVVAGTWFWSGIMKMNPSFAEFFPGLMQPFGLQGWAESQSSAAYLAGGVEALAGVLALIPPLRRAGFLIGSGMHLFILLALGPLGLSWNVVVWPWNMAFVVLAWAALWPRASRMATGSPSPVAATGRWEHLRRQPAMMIAVLLVWIAPFFNFFGHWDHFLSHSFYSARLPNAIFYFHPEDRFAIPVSARAHVLQVPGTTEYLLPLEFWALSELKTPGYPELGVRRQVARQLCSCMSDRASSGLRITHKDGLQARIRSESLSCRELLAATPQLYSSDQSQNP